MMKLPIGTVRVRTRHGRGGERRAFVKIADPNVWELRARVTWETAHGAIPRGMGIHHRDDNKLNDAIDNLELVSKARHLEIHRPEFQAKCIATLVSARKERRWSTKSATKRTGRPPTWTDGQLSGALAAVRAGARHVDASASFGVPARTIGAKLRLK